MQEHLSRRTLTMGAAWAVPAVAFASAAPAMAASCPNPEADYQAEVRVRTQSSTPLNDLPGPVEFKTFIVDESPNQELPAGAVLHYEFEFVPGSDPQITLDDDLGTVVIDYPLDEGFLGFTVTTNRVLKLEDTLKGRVSMAASGVQAGYEKNETEVREPVGPDCKQKVTPVLHLRRGGGS